MAKNNIAGARGSLCIDTAYVSVPKRARRESICPRPSTDLSFPAHGVYNDRVRDETFMRRELTRCDARFRVQLRKARAPNPIGFRISSFGFRQHRSKSPWHCRKPWP